MSIFTPIIQDEALATFTKILDKNDRWVDPKTQTATEIWSHWRANLTFPGTSLMDEVWGEIKIVECQLNPDFLTVPILEKLASKKPTVSPQENLTWNNFELTTNTEHLGNINRNQQNLSNQNISIISIKNWWIQAKIGKQTLTFLNCHNLTLLQVQAIKLANGQKIDLSGFQFK